MSDSFKLPMGMTEFENLAKNVIAESGLPDNDSVRFALATAILHFPHPKAELTQQYFVDVLLRGAANQVVSQVMQDLKDKQQKAIDEAKKQKEQEEAAAKMSSKIEEEQVATPTSAA